MSERDERQHCGACDGHGLDEPAPAALASPAQPGTDAALRDAIETALTVALHETFDPGCTGEPPFDSSQRLAAEVTAVVMRSPLIRKTLARLAPEGADRE